MCVTAIGNLMQESNKSGNPKIFFSRDKDIIPFIESHWESMTTTARRVTQSWHSTVCNFNYIFIFKNEISYVHNQFCYKIKNYFQLLLFLFLDHTIVNKRNRQFIRCP